MTLTLSSTSASPWSSARCSSPLTTSSRKLSGSKPDTPWPVPSFALSRATSNGMTKAFRNALSRSSWLTRYHNFSRLAVGDMYAFSKKFDQALAEANALIKEDPKWFYAWQSLGVTYFLMKSGTNR